MPRPMKWRTVCCLPQFNEFIPAGAPHCRREAVVMTVDEYETIRLIDLQSLSQEECAGNMRIARTTAQQIYASARRKIARALVNGLALRIEGGEYRLCDGESPRRGCGACRRRPCGHDSVEGEPNGGETE
jgi:uncharacterized protein